MTTKIGSLAVSLSLDASNFNGSMAQVDRNLRSMGSELKAAKALGKDYGKSVEGLASKKDILSRSVEASRIKLTETRKAYDELVSSGKASEAQIERQSKKVNDAQVSFNRLETELSEVDKALQVQSSSWTKIGDKMSDAGTKLKRVGDGMKDVGKNLTMKVTAPIIAAGGAAFKMATDYESAFAGVRKTVNMSEEGFQKLSGEIREMAKELPSAATEIAGVAEAAGQLGIENDALIGFTRTMVDLGVATNMVAGDAATALSRFANITQMSQEDFERLGSTVVELGNNFATTESEIVEMGLRLAGAGAQVGMTEADILALSAAMSSVGIEAEMGGSAMSRVLVEMQVATSTGFTNMQKVLKDSGLSLRDLQMMASHSGKAFGNMAEDMGMTKKELNNLLKAGLNLEGFADIAGMTGEQFKQAFEKDAVAALGEFINGLANAEEVGESAIVMLDEMGISEIRLRDSLLRAGGASKVFGDAIRLASEAWDENNALTNEAEERYKTTASQMVIMTNKLKDIGISIGEILIPKVVALMDKVDPLIDRFGNMSEESQNLIINIAGIAAVMGPVAWAAGSLFSGLGGLVTVAGAASTALGLGGVGLGATLTALALHPITLTIGGLALLGGAFVALDKHMDAPIVKSDIFAGEISKATQEAVGSYMKLNEEATAELNSLVWSQGVITDEMAASLIAKHKEMGDMVLVAMKEKHAEQLAAQAKMFKDSDVLTEQEEAKRMQKLEEAQLREVKNHNETEARKLEIITKANKEKRALTEAESTEIAKLNEKSEKEAVKVLSESQEEQKQILKNMKEQKGEIRAEEAAAAIKKSIETKDKVVEEAEETFRETVKTATESAETLGGISQAEAEAIIKEAELKKNEVVAKAEDMHYDVVKEARSQAGEHAKAVDEETGDVLTGWDQMYNGVIKAVNWITSIFGGKTFKVKGKVAPNKRQSMQGQEIKEYALGTKKNNHEGGPAIVGEEGVELAHIPGQGMTLVGTQGPELLANLPKGSAVLPNKQTENMLKEYGFPAYAKGVGDLGVFDLITKGAAGAWNYVTDKFDVSNKVLPQSFNNIVENPMGLVTDMAVDYIKGLFAKNEESQGGEGGAPVTFGNLTKTSSYGMRFHPIDKVWRLHAGDDYGGKLGTAIRATTSGIAVHSGPSGTGWGTMVKIRNGIYDYLYAHLSRAIAPKGSTVKKGDVIGALGSTGKSTGPHLHYEVHKNGRPIKPGAYANGGIVKKEELAMVGEKDKEEVIIPVGDKSKKARAVRLFNYAGNKLGVSENPKPTPEKVQALPPVRSTTPNKNQISDVKKILTYEDKETTGLITAREKKAKDEIKQLEKRSAEDIKLIHAKAKKAKRKITEAEAIKIRRLEEDTAKKIVNINAKAAKDVAKLNKDSQVDRIEEIKGYISDKQSLEQITLQDEVAIWSESVKHFKKGTDEKREAVLSLRDAKRAVDQQVLDDGMDYIDKQKAQGELSLKNEMKMLEELEKRFANHGSKFEAVQRRKADVVRQVNDKIQAVNEDFLSRTKQITDNLVNEIKRVEDEYKAAEDSRASSIASTYGLFENVEIPQAPKGEELMSNLESQADALRSWKKNINNLASRGVDEELLEQLRQMGPKILPELRALNGMTEKELSAYSDLFRVKMNMAREQAEKELSGMKDDAANNITDMKDAASNELGKLEQDWIVKVEGIMNETDTVLKGLKDVGINAGKGLMAGLSDMQGPLTEKAKDIAEAIKAEMMNAFEINSPSRWMRKTLAGNIGAGFVKGVDDIKSEMQNAAIQLSEWMKPETPQLEALAAPEFTGSTKFNTGSRDRNDGMIDQVLSVVAEQGQAIKRLIEGENSSYSDNPIIVENMVIREEADIEKISRRLNELRRREERGRR